MIGGAKSLAAISDAAADAEMIDFIGLRHPRFGLPHAGTIRRALITMDVASFEAALRRWASRRSLAHATERARLPAWLRGPGGRDECVYSLDGKVATGSTHDEVDPDTGEVTRRQAASASSTDTASGVVLTQTPMISVDEVAATAKALEGLAAVIDLAGAVIVADARHTGRTSATGLKARGAHYISP
ncbi:hypothetical protein SAMN06264364_119107 [Quadrisphaera granulorum]|uniref:DDE family transposase n=1 Tax=Quadrisphaera granulorum TaxID=317664 RepID=A0A316A562_9ACTN|nr:hypothetical protein BXY45_119107 [Quadrisphaera granulorum]SZE97662.1 hypothetical protein SAMN06264364_119107 [Quadrisphaera granulorum]